MRTPWNLDSARHYNKSPGLNQLAAHQLSSRTYTDQSMASGNITPASSRCHLENMPGWSMTTLKHKKLEILHPGFNRLTGKYFIFVEINFCFIIYLPIKYLSQLRYGS